MKSIAIIPARSGSKGLLNKNIKEFAGRPLMAYSIETALKSGCFDEVMLSTDSEEYAEIAKRFGASVPFLRSKATSGDSVSSWDMVKEVLDRYRKIGKEYESFCLLQPTSPLRTEEDIRNAYDLFENVATAVISVCEVEHSPLWCGKLPVNKSLDGFILRSNNKQRQASEKYYRINGAIYFVRTEELYKDDFLYREGSYAYIMPQNRSIDIDTEIDFKLAEILWGVLQTKKD